MYKCKLHRTLSKNTTCLVLICHEDLDIQLLTILFCVIIYPFFLLEWINMIPWLKVKTLQLWNQIFHWNQYKLSPWRKFCVNKQTSFFFKTKVLCQQLQNGKKRKDMANKETLTHLTLKAFNKIGITVAIKFTV